MRNECNASPSLQPWISIHLFLGYQFALLTQSFAVDIPHPPSSYAKTWSKQWEIKNNPNITMRMVYRKFLTELRSTTDDDSTVFVCHRYKSKIIVMSMMMTNDKWRWSSYY